VIKSLLIANRGEIAVRIIRTAKHMGIHTVAVYSSADINAQHVQDADESIFIGSSSPAKSYLNINSILEAASKSGVEAIHPGYGFLSENAGFAEACRNLDIIFVGPSTESIEKMGNKASAKKLMNDAEVPLLPGYHGKDQSLERLTLEAEAIGFPLLIKAVAGGGGRGMRIVTSINQFSDSLASAKREAQGSFGDDSVILEKYLELSRHIEVQIFGDSHGNIVHLFERDCSIQRRYQKVIEEAPAPGMSEARRLDITSAAISAAKSINYVGAGTVEFIVDSKSEGADGPFFFMEMNTRLQVEHPVTEMITGFDLVKWQLQVASGEPLPFLQKDIRITGHAVEARLYAEDPSNDFLPVSGKILKYFIPKDKNIRIDDGIKEGDSIALEYDSLLGKIIAYGPDRDAALSSLHKAICTVKLIGPITNQYFLSNILQKQEFLKGNINTNFINQFKTELIRFELDLLNEVILSSINFLIDERMTSERNYTNEFNSPWNASDSWNLNIPAQDIFYLRTLGEDYTINVFKQGDKWQACISGLTGKQYVVKQTNNAWVYRDQNILIFVKGPYQQRVDHVLPMDEAGSVEKLQTGLSAPMPGTIIKILADKGDSVIEGQTVMILEAMKMEHTILAPYTGTVSNIYYYEGDQVNENTELFEMLPVEK